MWHKEAREFLCAVPHAVAITLSMSAKHEKVLANLSHTNETISIRSDQGGKSSTNKKT